jgi:cystathionine beta-lyase
MQSRPEVTRVLYPALESDPGHAIWKRDFTGASGLFAVELTSHTSAQLAAMIDGYEYFGLGFSWGGFESLVMAANPTRTAVPWAGGQLVRFSIGLEDVNDLLADLEAGFARLNAAKP